ncbi:MAG TPA: hypothetical protein VK021_09415 [Flavobacteriaceae bacterium]|nr:hypothetical protein [Flavobacteriaceae bacterium]
MEKRKDWRNIVIYQWMDIPVIGGQLSPVYPSSDDLFFRLAYLDEKGKESEAKKLLLNLADGFYDHKVDKIKLAEI